jgi:hypothetical protein
MLGMMLGSAAWFTILAVLVGTLRASLGRVPWLFRGIALLSGSVLVVFALIFVGRAAAALASLVSLS